MNIINGEKGAWPQPTEYGLTEAGTYSTVPFESTDADTINRLAAQFLALGYLHRVTHSFGKSRIEVQLSFNQGATEVPIDLWEYQGRETPKDVMQAATNTGITGTLTVLNIEVIRLAMSDDWDKIPNASKDAAGIHSLNLSCFTDGNPANALLIYNLMKSGMSDYPIQAPILRHTQTVSQIYPITLSQLNVGKLISTATLFALETVPSWALNGLPNIAPPAFSDGKQFAFAWYKSGPTIQQIAFRKVQIVQEFQYGLWPTAVFGSPL